MRTPSTSTASLRSWTIGGLPSLKMVEKYVFKRFQWRLPEVLKEVYFVEARQGKIMTLREANK